MNVTSSTSNTPRPTQQVASNVGDGVAQTPVSGSPGAAAFLQAPGPGVPPRVGNNTSATVPNSGTLGPLHPDTVIFNRQLNAWVNGAPPAEQAARRESASEIRRVFNEGSNWLRLGGKGLTSLPECLQKMVSVTHFSAIDNALSCLPAMPENLQFFYACDNQLTRLPNVLPDGLRRLMVEGNELTELPALPKGLRSLAVGRNRLARLPAQLPGSLEQLSISRNQLTSLPALPQNLKWLLAAGNSLASLPPLPSGVLSLNVSENKLSSIPALPPGITELKASHNRLSQLPTLPDCLDYLNISNNKIFTLPLLPAGLTILDAANNALTNLPEHLPANLRALSVAGNRLGSLPDLPPGLEFCGAEGNRLSALPPLPQSLAFLHVGRNQLINLSRLTPSLQKVTADDNQLASLPAPLPASLTELSVSNNRLTGLPLLPPSLNVLDTANNPGLASIPLEALQDADAIREWQLVNPTLVQGGETSGSAAIRPRASAPVLRENTTPDANASSTTRSMPGQSSRRIDDDRLPIHQQEYMDALLVQRLYDMQAAFNE